MKKIIILAAIALVTFAGCGKDPGTISIGFKAPEQKENAVKYDIPEEQVQAQTGEQKYTGFEAAESGIYIIDTNNGVLTGTFTMDPQNPKKYICEPFGTVEIVEVTRATTWKLVFTPKNQTPVECQAEPVEKVEPQNQKVATLLEQIVNTWKVQKTIISVSGENISKALGVAHGFEGCSLPAVKEYVQNAGYTIDYDFTGYIVKDITISERGTFLIRFTGKESYKGEWELDENGNFAYEMSYESAGNPLVNGSAEGKISPNQETGICDLTINAKVDYDGGVNATVIFKLVTE